MNSKITNLDIKNTTNRTNKSTHKSKKELTDQITKLAGPSILLIKPKIQSAELTNQPVKPTILSKRSSIKLTELTSQLTETAIKSTELSTHRAESTILSTEPIESTTQSKESSTKLT